jgi:hypothetical protein
MDSPEQVYQTWLLLGLAQAFLKDDDDEQHH